MICVYVGLRVLCLPVSVRASVSLSVFPRKRTEKPTHKQCELYYDIYSDASVTRPMPFTNCRLSVILYTEERLTLFRRK